MPHCLYRLRFSKDAIKALVKNPQDRTEAARAIIESTGGKLHHYFFAFGDFDVVVLAEYPDGTSMAAASMVVGSAGVADGMETTVLLTMDEAVAAMQKAKDAASSYVPPQA